MSGAARRAKGAQPTTWWQRRRNRRRLGVAAALVVVVAVAAAIVWFAGGGGGGGMGAEASVPVGRQVHPVSLEDSRTGQMYDLSRDIGKKDVVLVAYMGDFCLGCRELLSALQTRAPDFAAAGAALVVLGYETGQTGRTTAANRGITAYPLLQEGGLHSFTKSVGMWSDMMDMPFMGYVIIGKDGKIMAGEQSSLSEAPGAASSNVDAILAALKSARTSR